MAELTIDKKQTLNQENDSLIVDLDKVPSNVLKRLIGEVQHEAKNDISAYNRTHNRHNRGR